MLCGFKIILTKIYFLLECIVIIYYVIVMNLFNFFLFDKLFVTAKVLFLLLVCWAC